MFGDVSLKIAKGSIGIVVKVELKQVNLPPIKPLGLPLAESRVTEMNVFDCRTHQKATSFEKHFL
jgi:hypothetical protein